jgi:hypothetical protein
MVSLEEEVKSCKSEVLKALTFLAPDDGVESGPGSRSRMRDCFQASGTYPARDASIL